MTSWTWTKYLIKLKGVKWFIIKWAQLLGQSGLDSKAAPFSLRGTSRTRLFTFVLDAFSTSSVSPDTCIQVQKSSPMWHETRCWIYLSWLCFCWPNLNICLHSSNFKQSESWFINCQNLLLISGLSFKHFKSVFIFLSIASRQHLVVMLHLPFKAFCLPSTWMLSIHLSHQRKLSLFELLSHPHATYCLNLHVTNLLTI